MMFLMNLVISTDQLHYWELVMLYFMHASVLVLFILIIVCMIIIMTDSKDLYF